MAERTLKTEGLIGSRMFRVAGDLVGNYNRALRKTIEKETSLKIFHIDKRGESPEIEEELGENYLQCGSANRYMIVISPAQKEAELLHEEFSFDERIFDFLYRQHLPGIETVTRTDGMYGLIDTGINVYNGLEDMLLIRNVNLELFTPSGFVVKARELLNLTKDLRKYPDLLVEDESAVPRRMLELVEEVGDLRGLNIGDFAVQEEVDAFYSRLFGGIYVFRDWGHPRTKKEKEPGGSAKETLDFPKATVVYNDEAVDRAPQPGPKADFIPLSETGKVIDFLLKNEYARFSRELIGSRLSILEDVFLIDRGHDVAGLSDEQRRRLFSDEISRADSHEWKKLRALQTDLAKGLEMEKRAAKEEPLVKAMILEPEDENVNHIPVVSSLLTKIWPFDLVRMYRYNRRDLEHLFDRSELITRNYILDVLGKHKKSKAKNKKGNRNGQYSE